MKSTASLIAAAMAVVAMSNAAHATVYTLAGQDIFPATAAGSITTDGTLGVLAYANITGIDITVADPAGSAVVDGSYQLFGTALTATVNGLFFNYSGASDSLFLSAVPGGVSSAYCISTGSPINCEGVLNSESILVDTVVYQGPPLIGSTVEIATAAVPEPVAWALMLVGFGAVGSAVRRSRRRAHIAA